MIQANKIVDKVHWTCKSIFMLIFENYASLCKKHIKLKRFFIFKFEYIRHIGQLYKLTLLSITLQSYSYLSKYAYVFCYAEKKSQIWQLSCNTTAERIIISIIDSHSAILRLEAQPSLKFLFSPRIFTNLRN